MAWVANPLLGRIVAPPLAIQVDGVEEFEVNSILDSRIRRRKLEYYVDWVGYDVFERSWEPAVVFDKCKRGNPSFSHKISISSPSTRGLLLMGGFC